ncbi:MAG TPA: hypothetical protein VNG69_18765, partial [Casimicrobiaceae bacterium]|nr:hypothetical protein [Casimicrobiaceae bacterium]
MFNHTTTQRSLPIAIVLAVGVCSFGSSDARVTRIEIDTTTNIAGQPYQELTGRAFGELDPNDSHNTLITDIALAPRNANGKVAYVAS